MTRGAALTLPEPLLAAMLEAARRAAPFEAVGLLVGEGRRARRLVALPNAAREPRIRFFAEPQALVLALMDIDARGEELIALYHSHPEGPAEPSPRDLAEARYGVPSLIVVPGPAVVRAFDLSAAGWQERDLLVEIVERAQRAKSVERRGATGPPEHPASPETAASTPG